MNAKRKPGRPRKEETAAAKPKLREPAVLNDGTLKRLNFVPNWNDLALSLGISRKSLQNWRNREDLCSAADFPRPRSDSRHDVNAWRRFMIARGLNRADEKEEHPDQQPNERRSLRDWKEYHEQLKCREIERRIAQVEGSLIEIREVEEGVTRLLLAVVNRLAMLPIRAMQTLAGFSDPHDIRAELEKEIGDLLEPIRTFKWLPEGALSK